MPLLPEGATVKNSSDLFSVLEKDDFFKLRLRAVPFHGAGNCGGVLVGLKPDRFWAGKEEKEVILALDDSFFKNGQNYDAILNL